MGKLKKVISYVPRGSFLKYIEQTIKENQKEGIWGKAIYVCKCGVKKEIGIRSVKSGRTKSCGCLHKKIAHDANVKHGLYKHPLYRIWIGMVARCGNPKNYNWKYYGGRGVSVCAKWRNNFVSFYKWAISHGWTNGMHIDKDKIPRELGVPAALYSPKMCSVLSANENSGIRSSNRIIKFNGETKTRRQWERKLGFNIDTIRSRLRYGWSEEKALTTPVRKRGQRKKIFVSTLLKSVG